MMRRYVLASLWLLAAALAPATRAQPAQAGPPVVFRIGVAPHTSARVILEMYQPLRLHLEQALQRPVQVVTAADFTDFARRAVGQQYDLVVTTGHQARLLQSDAQYLPLLTYKADFKAVVLVAAQSPVRRAADLAGSTVFGLSPSSLVTIWGQHWLKRNGLDQVTVRYVSAADSVAQLVLKGEAAAAFTSLANYQALGDGVREQLRVLDESVPLAGRVYLLNTRHTALKDRVDTALWAFAETPDAKAYFARYKLGGYRKLEPRELNGMEPYAAEVRQSLKAPAR